MSQALSKMNIYEYNMNDTIHHVIAKSFCYNSKIIIVSYVFVNFRFFSKANIYIFENVYITV